MAEAIARGLLAREPFHTPTVIRSAGISGGGGPYTRETITAVETLGYPAPAGYSQRLDRDMLRDAQHIFAMTTSHLAAVRAMSPESAARAVLLDPDGRDVPDPIGGAQSLYDSTARFMRDMIVRRLAEVRQKERA